MNFENSGNDCDNYHHSTLYNTFWAQGKKRIIKGAQTILLFKITSTSNNSLYHYLSVIRLLMSKYEYIARHKNIDS